MVSRGYKNLLFNFFSRIKEKRNTCCSLLLQHPIQFWKAWLKCVLRTSRKDTKIWFFSVGRSVCTSVLYKNITQTHSLSMCSSCHLPCLPQSGNAAPSLPIKLQSTDQDGVRHRITSNILSHTPACRCQPQISLQIKALKMGEVELPDNNQITSCQRLDVYFQVGSSFLPPLEVQWGGVWVFPGWALTVHFNQHSSEGWWKLTAPRPASLEPCFLNEDIHGQPNCS